MSKQTPHGDGVGSTALLGHAHAVADEWEVATTNSRIELRAQHPRLAKALDSLTHWIAKNPVGGCRICNGTGWNYGAQPGPGPGYKTVECQCMTPNAN